MIANYRYLHASLFSFCVHAAIFLYIYGTFDGNTSQKILISKPLQIEIKFDLPSQKTKEIAPPSTKAMNSIQKQPTEDIIYSKTQTITESFQDRALIESSITNLLTEEAEVEVSKEQQEIAIYAQRIISTIEDAWMKPRNIPENLVANLRLKIRPSGRIIGVDLIKSSGNIRFDNSVLQAVRRVEVFNFFNSIPKTLFEKEFQVISISFNPS
jgi:colicin import membrane protein